MFYYCHDGAEFDLLLNLAPPYFEQSAHIASGLSAYDIVGVPYFTPAAPSPIEAI